MLEMDPEDIEELEKRKDLPVKVKAWVGHEKLLNMLEAAWGIIANVDWRATTNPPDWREAAIRWRDEYHKLLQEETLPEVEPEDIPRPLSSEEVWSLVKKEKQND